MLSFCTLPLFTIALLVAGALALQPQNAETHLIYLTDIIGLSVKNPSCNPDDDDDDPSGLVRRDETSDKFKAAVCKGDKLLALMQASEEHAAKIAGQSQESPFQDTADIEQNGWSAAEMPMKTRLSMYDFPEALEAIGIEEPTGPDTDNRIIALKNDRPYTVSGQEYPGTQGIYLSVFNTKSLVIAALSNYGPRYKLAGTIGAENQPPPTLERWSDLVFLEWQALMGGSGGRIDAPRSADKLYWPDWPGMTFSTKRKKGKAILGTPNVFGVAYFLIQHKSKLGNQVITQITVFKSSSTMAKMLLLKIEAA
ncbi:hypothetical protein EJ06DRAFT_524275 [Trichodelitschia bisporula]|uniref:Uncharacterized protein n=1 Tax=Trichodelitschia bisporula TaxID=703511 RepID=A0A6G1HL85_9PEZI|nr:hypothetical protein EJ06DRAFT_524275 [Trichodelitschia bisporula]